MVPSKEAGSEAVSGKAPGLGPVVQIDEGRIQAHLDEVVQATVEETLNALLDAEADELCGARKYERTEDRKDTRAGSHDRQLHTKAGEVTLTVPKLRTLPFKKAIIERYKRRESSVEEALIEMNLAGVSVRRVEDITQALWGTRVGTRNEGPSLDPNRFEHQPATFCSILLRMRAAHPRRFRSRRFHDFRNLLFAEPLEGLTMV